MVLRFSWNDRVQINYCASIIWLLDFIAVSKRLHSVNAYMSLLIIYISNSQYVILSTPDDDLKLVETLRK